MEIKKKKKLGLGKGAHLTCSRLIHDVPVKRIFAFLFVLGSLVALDKFLKLPQYKTKTHHAVSFKKSTQKPHELGLNLKKKKNQPKWWDEKHLSLYAANLTENLIDKDYASFIAKRAVNRARRLNSRGNCLRAVKFTLWNAISKFLDKPKFLDLNKVSFDPGRYSYKYNPGKSAEHFRKWATENPISLYRELHLADVSHIPGLPLQKGFILIYAKNTQGFHKQYGHIEIVTELSPLKACSDHCRSPRSYKKPSLILAPVKNYAPLFTFEDHSKQSKTENSI